jgi:hypothetical protein
VTSILQSIPAPTKIRDELEQMVLKDRSVSAEAIADL